MNEFNHESDDKEKVLDEWEKGLAGSRQGGRGRLRFFWARFGRFGSFFRKLFILFLILFFIYAIYRGITSPPKYSEEQTTANGKRFEQLIQNTSQFKPRFEGALKILKQYPDYYAKVVNNMEQIEINTEKCKYMCIWQSKIYYSFSDAVFSGGEVIGKAKLYINPDNINAFRTDVDFASSLIHEADHVEFIRSGRLRKSLLWLKCNPLVNPKISIDSYIPDLEHRIKPMEICAEKEEINFHKLLKIPSQYEMGRGILRSFWYSIKNSLQLIFSVFR